LTKNDNSLAWVLVGAGNEKTSLQAKCDQLGLNNVYFIAPIAKVQVQTMLAQFDVCYIGWKNDPIYQFGIAANKIPEYLYSGKPIVHSFSGYGDPVSNANAGLSVPAENPRAIVDAVQKLKAMSHEQLGQNGRYFVIKNHDYAELAVRLSKVILGENEKTV